MSGFLSSCSCGITISSYRKKSIKIFNYPDKSLSIGQTWHIPAFSTLSPILYNQQAEVQKGRRISILLSGNRCDRGRESCTEGYFRNIHLSHHHPRRLFSRSSHYDILSRNDCSPHGPACLPSPDSNNLGQCNAGRNSTPVHFHYCHNVIFLNILHASHFSARLGPGSIKPG